MYYFGRRKTKQQEFFGKSSEKEMLTPGNLVPACRCPHLPNACLLLLRPGKGWSFSWERSEAGDLAEKAHTRVWPWQPLLVPNMEETPLCLPFIGQSTGAILCVTRNHFEDRLLDSRNHRGRIQLQPLFLFHFKEQGHLVSTIITS